MLSDTDIVISIENLSKTFGKFKALENLSLTIKKGEIYGLVGPNGAGKTTVILILLGILEADKGTKINIWGKEIPVKFDRVNPYIGYMPQDITLYLDISIKQNLQFFGTLYGIPKKRLKERINHVLSLIDLIEFQDRVLSKCSGGMQRRSSLACALLHEPKILILDEPTVGIDPELRITFWNYFRKVANEGITILITTHYLAESVRCDRVGFINKRLIIEGNPNDLKESVKTAKHQVDLPNMEEVFIHYTKINPNRIGEDNGKIREENLE